MRLGDSLVFYLCEVLLMVVVHGRTQIVYRGTLLDVSLQQLIILYRPLCTLVLFSSLYNSCVQFCGYSLLTQFGCIS